MGTLVEDAAEVATLATAIDNAILTKGGSLVGGGKLRNAVAGIESIPTGGSSDERIPFSFLCLPNLYTVLKNDTEDYSRKIVFLISPSEDTTYIPALGDLMKTGDGATYTSSASHTWASKDISQRYIIAYKNSGDFTSVPSKYNLLAIVGNDAAKLRTYMDLEQAYGLLCMDVNGGSWTNYSNSSLIYLFAGENDSYSLSSCQQFHNCVKLLRVPKTILGNVDDISYAPPAMKSFWRVMDIQNSHDFSGANSMYDRDSLVKFVDGSIPDTQTSQTVDMGWFNNIKSTPVSGATITLSSNVKVLFSSEEQTAIATFMTGKGFSLSW